jgi:RNA polymerase sigma-70 factor (ECF subfamily)
MSAEVPELGEEVCLAIDRRYEESKAERYGISRKRFRNFVVVVVRRYAGSAGNQEQMEVVAGIHVAELMLARACSAGNETAWEVFLTRFRVPLYDAAYRIAGDEATGRELADELYTDLYGIPNSKGDRRSRLDYYMGRGSLEGWLRTVLSQQYVNRYRAHAREVSLDEQMEAGVSFADRATASDEAADSRVAAAVTSALAALIAEDRFLLASYYLDQRTLAEIGRQLQIHESTVSRKLQRLTKQLQKSVRKQLQAAGVSRRRCDELMQDMDVRDLHVDIAANLRQEIPEDSFSKRIHP